MGVNPVLIQKAPPGHESSAPLFLVHDGSGTISSYFRLCNLQRNVYAFSNPHFESGKPWVGGIPAMARLYSELLRCRYREGEILLGGESLQRCPGSLIMRTRQQRPSFGSLTKISGWSLGGLISLEISRYLSRKYPELKVLGIVMIDSAFPKVPSFAEQGLSSTTSVALESCPLTLKPLVQTMLHHSRDLVNQWSVPQWSGKIPASSASVSRKLAQSPSAEQTLRIQDTEFEPPDSWMTDDPGMVTPCSCGMGTVGPRMKCASRTATTDNTCLPPTILLRSDSRVPSKDENVDETQTVDVYRDCPSLGWDHSQSGFFELVLDVSGHHFDIFSPENVSFCRIRLF